MAATVSTGFLIFDLLFVLAGAVLAFYVYSKHNFQYWKRKGVPYLEPTFIYGNNPFLISKSPTLSGETKDWYDELKKRGHKFGGAFSFTRKVLVLVDPEYIKDVLSKDFQYFTDRDFYVNENDPTGTHLLNIKGEKWKLLRQKLTPTFTSGKMKMMFNSLVKCSEHMKDFLETNDKIGDDIDVREVSASYTTDVIGAIAFGIEYNSFKDPNGEFRTHGRTLFRMTPKRYLKAFIMKVFPGLARQLVLQLRNPETTIFFKKVLTDAMEYREKNNIRKTDFLQILMDMNAEHKDKENSFSFDEIISNSILFFVAGFDTSSTLMTYAFYELAKNPDIQEKLREEIKNVLKNHNEQITYDAIKEMTYLKQCMEETLRIHPSALMIPRVCTKEYQLRDTDIIIEKGTTVVIPIMGLGRDPANYPDPMKFDPNRFSPEEIAKRHPFTHIPFGEGPRNCIGRRFGQMQAEIGLVQVLSNFRLKVTPKTKIPLKFDKAKFLLTEIEPLYLKCEKI